MVDAIVSHQVDVVLCTFPTPDRLRRVDFAALLHRVGVGAVVRSKQGRVKSADDLKRPDIYVGVVKGEVGWEYSRAFLTLDGNSRFKVLDPECMSDLIELVRAGEVDVVLCDALSCRHWSDKKAARDELSVNPFIVWKPEVGVMVPTGEPDLKEWLTRCFRLARSSPSASSEESRILNEYPGIVERID
jgi:ABC-type amino acid transport substrate-binding protein